MCVCSEKGCVCSESVCVFRERMCLVSLKITHHFVSLRVWREDTFSGLLLCCCKRERWIEEEIDGEREEVRWRDMEGERDGER